jgi:uracil-DNA glycosylase family 4
LNKNKGELLEKIYEKMRKCNKCEISKLEINVERPKGSGNLDAEIFLVGIAPSAHRIPTRKKLYEGVFSSDSPVDLLLYSALETVGLSRMDVFCTNVLKCSTPNNRSPNKIEIKNCMEYLLQEIDVINPNLIIAMGSIPASIFQLTILPSIQRRLDGRIYAAIIHPAYAVRMGKQDEFIRQFKYVYKTYKFWGIYPKEVI